MTFVAAILIVITFWMFHHDRKGDKKEYSSWKELFITVVKTIVRYRYELTPAKIVKFALQAILIIYELSAFSIPFIRAGIKYQEGGKYWDAFIECQWDSVGTSSTIVSIVAIVIITVVYLLKARYETETDKKILANTAETNEVVKRIENNVGRVLENQQKQMARAAGNSNSSTIRTLMQNYGTDIQELRIASAYRHLEAIEQALKNESNNDVQLLATVQCSLGICARYIIDKPSKKHYDEAYRLIKSQVVTDTLLYTQILEGKIYVACKMHNREDAHAYADELRTIKADDYWVYVPELIDADDLNAAYEAIPERVPKFMALTNAIMVGCKAQDYQLGVDLETYSYQGLTELTYDNFPVWIFELSIAATKFVQKMSLHRYNNALWSKETDDLYNLTHLYLELLRGTEMSNLLPDTVFLESLTGYIKDHDKRRLEVMEQERGKARFKELYYLGYAMMLMDQNCYPEAMQLLKEYGEGESSSIINMRLAIAFRTEDKEEIIKAVRDLTSRKLDIPDHLLHNYIEAFNLFFDELQACAKDVKIQNAHSQFVFDQFVAFRQGKETDIARLQEEEKDIDPYLYVYVAMIYKEAIGLDKAIELLKKCVDTHVVDLRSYYLLSYYREDRNYGVERYHLLRELRMNRATTVEWLCEEMGLAESIHDYAAVVDITQQLLTGQPDNPVYLVHRIQALWKIGDYDAVRGYKERLQGLSITDIQSIEVIAKIFEYMHEEAFAVEWVYRGYELTKNQKLKDFLYQQALNPRIGNVICATHEMVGIGDVVEIGQGEAKKCIEIVAGSTYAAWVGKREGETVTMRQGEMRTATITAIHNKYYKIYIEEHQDVYEDKSETIRSFSVEDVINAEDPLAVLQKMSGTPPDFAKKQEEKWQSYAQGKLSLISLMHSVDNVAGMLNVLYDPKFVAINQSWEDSKRWKNENGEPMVLDLSSVIRLSDLCKKGAMEMKQKCLLPISVKMELEDTLNREDCHAATFVHSYVWDAVTVPETDAQQTPLWKVTKAMLEWVEAHCEVQIVEEKLKGKFKEDTDEMVKMELDSIALAADTRIMVTEDIGIRDLCKTISVGQFMREGRGNGDW